MHTTVLLSKLALFFVASSAFAEVNKATNSDAALHARTSLLALDGDANLGPFEVKLYTFPDYQGGMKYLRCLTPAPNSDPKAGVGIFDFGYTKSIHTKSIRVGDGFQYYDNWGAAATIRLVFQPKNSDYNCVNRVYKANYKTIPPKKC